METHQKAYPKTTHLDFLTDEFGVWQHCKKGEIFREEGYALDDSARALIVYLLYGDIPRAKICLNYIETSLNGSGDFHYFFTPDREPVSFGRLGHDAFGLAIWALGYAHSVGFELEKVEQILAQLNLDFIVEDIHIRPLAYGLLAFSYLKQRERADAVVKDLLSTFDTEKGWFEDKLYYANAIIPYALLVYCECFSIDDPQIIDTIYQAIETLKQYMYVGKIPSPVGNTHWQEVGSKLRDISGQQPIEAAFMVLLLCKAYQANKNSTYKEMAEEWMEWFYGNNIFKQSLIDDKYGCADGIDENGISENQGSESTIVYLWAAKVLKNTLEA